MPTTLDLDPIPLLTAAAHGFLAPRSQARPDGKTLTAALLMAEKTAKQTRQSLSLESLLGTWRLCFSAGKKAKFQSGQPMGNGFYVPQLAIARITFAHSEASEDLLVIKNELQVGPLTVRFTGPARYPGKKNLLAFDFTHLQLQCFGLTIYSGKVGKRDEQSFAATPIAKLPFFAFFAATEDYIAARGRGGGLAIWVRE
ncbi:hypothetical protein [Halomicronema sp. CCY15110]|uniref:hypothetical protein n=1 Tax=Halomicronema sp. CCY15110 TaxID=2767773 RepID=UPI0019523E07|nr:hypothetical protein [Halomicronema sp. CCY15110]